jgi:hypothetical protein
MKHARVIQAVEAAPVLDLCSHGHEGLLHVCCVLGAGLQEGNANLVREGLQAVKLLTVNT